MPPHKQQQQQQHLFSTSAKHVTRKCLLLQGHSIPYLTFLFTIMGHRKTKHYKYQVHHKLMIYKGALIFLIDGDNICERPHYTAMFSSREKQWQMATTLTRAYALKSK